MMKRLAFNRFLLSLSKKLGQSDFKDLKLSLYSFVPLRRSEGFEHAFEYFAELERMRLLAPTDLSILRKGFKQIGRQDLVQELDETKDYFNQLFQPKLRDHQKGLYLTEFLARLLRLISFKNKQCVNQLMYAVFTAKTMKNIWSPCLLCFLCRLLTKHH